MFYLLKQLKLAKRLGKITGRLPLLCTSTKRSEQPQGDFFAQIAVQREPCSRKLEVYSPFDYAPRN